MDIALSDLLTCPRCGPQYGLVLLPTEVVDRRVVTGVLGCANCRERYRIEGGVADLRPGGVGVGRTASGGEFAEAAGGRGGASVGEAGGWADDPEAGIRLAALLGLTDGGGGVVLAGEVAGAAESLLAVVPELTVVALGEGEGRGEGVPAGVSRLRVGGVVPLRDRSVRGVALAGEWAARLEEGIRLVSTGGRLVVVDHVPGDGRGRVEAAGLEVLLEEGPVLVAGRGR